MKILRRIYVALVMIVLAVGVAAILLFHTSAGRELVRAQVEQRLATLFVGKVSIGSVEGDPFGEMFVRDLAIDDRDGHPAIRAKLVRVRLSLLALAHRVVHVDRLIVEGAELHVSRGGDGTLEVAQLVHHDQRSHWSFELPDIRIATSRLVVPGETIERVELRGRLDYPFGAPLVASVAGAAVWRDAPVFAIASLQRDERGLRIPHALVARRGAAIAVTGAELRGTQVTGTAVVAAAKSEAARLGLALPDDVLAFAAFDGQLLDAVGRLGATPMQLIARVDLEARRIAGVAISAPYELPRGRFGGVATFSLALGPDGGLPIGTAFAQLRADVAEAPDAQVGLAVSSDGTTAHVAIDATSRGSRALFGGDVAREAKQIALRGARLIASGVLDGTPLRANLGASGPLYPNPDLAITGSVDAGAASRRGVTATSVHLTVDARHVPAQPAGRARLHVDGLAARGRLIGALDATLTTLAGGRYALTADAGPHHADATVAYDRRTRRLVADATARSPFFDALAAHAALVVPRRGGDWRGAIEQATLRATGIHAEPALLAQLGVSTTFGATVDVTADVDHRAGGLVASVHRLHGGGLAQPLDLRVEVDTDPRHTRARVALRGPAGVNLGDLDVTVGAALHADAPITGTLVLTGAPAPMYAAVLGRDQITGGLIAGTLAITGTLAQPAIAGELVARGVMTPATHGGTVLAVLDELRVTGSWRAGALALRVDGKEHAGGTLALTANGRLDDPDHFQVGVLAHAFDLAPVLALIPGPAAGGLGRVDADLAMTGLDVRTAKLSGKLHVAEGRLPLSPTIGTLRRATFDATLDGQTAHLALDAMLGAGTVKGTGSIALVDGVPTQGEIALQVRGVEPIGIAHPAITADLTGTVRRDGTRWLADVVIDHGLVVIPRKPGVRLHDVGAPAEMVFVRGGQPKSVTKRKEVPLDPSFVLSVEIRPTRIVDRDMRGVVSGKLLVSDNHRAIGVLGDLTAARGDVDLFGRRYVVERAALHFDGSTDPLLDVRISHDFNDVTTTTTIRGRFTKPDVAMSSSPAVYTQGQLLGFLLGGEPSGDPRDVTARDRATNAGTSLIANEIGTYVRGALPLKIDIIRYQSGSPESSAAVTAGTWVTHDVFLAYRRHLEARPDENENESDLELWLTHHLSVEGTAGDRGYAGIDLLWRTRY